MKSPSNVSICVLDRSLRNEQQPIVYKELIVPQLHTEEFLLYYIPENNISFKALMYIWSFMTSDLFSLGVCSKDLEKQWLQQNAYLLHYMLEI